MTIKLKLREEECEEIKVAGNVRRWWDQCIVDIYAFQKSVGILE